MKKMLALSLTLLFCFHANAKAPFREIDQKQCMDSEGEVIADAKFEYTKVMVDEASSLIGFLKTVDGCNTGDFVLYLTTSRAQVNGVSMSQAIPGGLGVMSKNCRGETGKSDINIFQSAQLFTDKVILTTPHCAELSLTLKPAVVPADTPPASAPAVPQSK
jgi:hypothetical protein